MKSIKILTIFITSIISLNCNNAKGTINKNYLIGSWATSSEDNVDFIITTENIQYFEDLEIGNNCLGIYKLERNTFTPFDCSGHLIADYEIIYLTQDSMKWKTEDGSILQFVKR